MENPHPTRFERFAPALIFLLVFGFALAGLDPTFYANDSPETVTACATFGIPHPPGYPLHTFIGHLFSGLPLGSVPFRVNLLSAVLAASVCVLLFLFLRRSLGLSVPLSAAIASLWVTGATVYPASLSAKTGIYLMTAVFLLAILWALFEERTSLAVFLFGLSFANHWMSMAALFPGFALLAYFQWKEKKGVLPAVPENQVELGSEPVEIPVLLSHPFRSRFLIFPALAALGLSVYLVLPIRAHLDPLLNWGEPSTWSNFRFNFLRSQYGSAAGEGNAVSSFTQTVFYFKTAFLEFSGLLLAAGFGVAAAYRKDRRRALGTAAAWGSLAAAVCLYLGLPTEQLYLIDDYALASHVFILLFAAWGLQLFLSGTGHRTAWERVVLSVLLLFVLGTAGLRYHKARQTGYTYTYDYVLNAFKALPKDTVFLCKGDSIVFPCWYFQWVEKKRPDIAIIGVDGFPMEWVRKTLVRTHPGLPIPFTAKPVGPEAIPSMVQWTVERNKDKPLYFSYNKIEDGTLAGTRMIPYGLVGEAFLPGREGGLEELRADLLWRGMRLRHLKDERFPVDGRTERYMVGDYAVFRNALGVVYEDLGDDLKARRYIRADPEVLARIQYDYQKSYEHFFWAAQWMPGDAQYAYNTGNALFHLDRLGDSMQWYEKAVKLKPDYTIAYFNWAVAALQTRSYLKAGQLFDKVLELKPDHVEARQGLEYLKGSGFYKGTQ